MTLYEYLKENECDFDTSDTEFDVTVTVCYIDKSDVDNSYDSFCLSLFKKIQVVDVSEDIVICNWSGFIKRNLEDFKDFSKKYWKHQYEDEDDFIYQWIRELHFYLAGYVSEKFYDNLLEFISKIE